MVYLFFLIIRQIKTLEEDNTFTLSHLTGKTGTVYLSIPSNVSGSGKIQISVKGTVHELDAITDGEKIETGSKIKVVEVVDNNLIKVIKL